jgi:hypothetical protein
MSQHCNRIERASLDLHSWYDTIEQQLHDYYQLLLKELCESTDPADEVLYDKLDREYARQCASLQAARERTTEAAAHLKNAVLSLGHTGHLANITPETFQ